MSSADAPISGGATRSVEEWTLSHFAQAGHHEPGLASVVVNHLSAAGEQEVTSNVIVSPST